MPVKDPDAKLPFAVDWSAWLTNEGDTAATVTWIAADGIVQETSPAPALADGVATAWFSGGTDGQDYKVTCRLTTTGGRIDDRTVTIKVRQR